VLNDVFLVHDNLHTAQVVSQSGPILPDAMKTVASVCAKHPCPQYSLSSIKISCANTHNNSYAHQAQQQLRAPPAWFSPASRTRNRNPHRTSQELAQRTADRSLSPYNKRTTILKDSQHNLNKGDLMSFSPRIDLLHPLGCRPHETKKVFHDRRARPAISVSWIDPIPPQASQEVAH
jgi:hypothetical protein